MTLPSGNADCARAVVSAPDPPPASITMSFDLTSEL